MDDVDFNENISTADMIELFEKNELKEHEFFNYGEISRHI